MKMKLKMNNNFSLKKLFFNDKFVIAFSIVAAVVLWFSITVIEAPDTEFVVRNVPVTIPIEGSAASERGLDVLVENNATQNVDVTVKGPMYIVTQLTANDINVTASLSNVIAPGKYNLELTAKKVETQKEFTIVGTNPNVILATFDYIDTKSFEITTEANGVSAITGLVAEKPVVSDNNYSVITVKGPRTELAKIDRIRAKIDVNETLSQTTNYTTEIELLDEDGKALSKSPFKITAIDGTEVTTVSISVPISKTKEVPVKVSFTNLPEGFDATKLKYKLNYDRIYVIGPEETINSINELQLQPINLFELSPDNNKFNVVPLLPSGVKIYDQVTSIEVVFDGMSSYQTKTFTVTNFNSTSDVQGVLASEIKNVKICAPTSVMRKITAKNLVATADLSGKTTGNHIVDVLINCNVDGMIWQLGFYTATITVK